MNKWIGKTLTTRQALELPPLSTIEVASAIYQRVPGGWHTPGVQGVVQPHDPHFTAKLIFCPVDNWEPSAEKEEEEENIVIARSGNGCVLYYASTTKDAARLAKKLSNPIAILRVRDCVPELLDVDGKAMHPKVDHGDGFTNTVEKITALAREHDSVIAERDRLAGEVKVLKEALDFAKFERDRLRDRVKVEVKEQTCSNAGINRQPLTVEELNAHPPVPIKRFKLHIKDGCMGQYIELEQHPQGPMMRDFDVLAFFKEQGIKFEETKPAPKSVTDHVANCCDQGQHGI